MISVTIDGKTIQTEPTKTIIEAAFENGIYIPHFCWHPFLSISGNCRMCLVDVEKMPKQVIACSTLCMDGMVVHVNNEKAINARNAVMEFILINHPLDCPICDEAGECKLQEYAYRYSVGESRFDEEKQHNRKRARLGPHVVFDAERCISCSRCIRFCEDIIGYPQLTFVERGDRVTIVTLPGKELDNPYSMNVIDICPVGALTNADFRFKARVWDMSETASVCSGCARGCNVHSWVRQNKILRYTPRENPEVNDFWMCDEGRIESWRHVAAENRIQQPSIRKDGRQAPVGWDEALSCAAMELRGFHGEEIAVLGSAFETCEDNYALARLAREVLKTPLMDVLPHITPEKEDGFLRRADRTPNSAGAKLAGMTPASSNKGMDAIIDGLARGAIKAVVVTDNEAWKNLPFMNALAKARLVIAIVSNASPLTDTADVVLSASTFAEKSGTFLNFEHQLQLLNPSIATAENERWRDGLALSRLDRFASPFDRWGTMPRIDCRSTFMIVAQLASLFGCKWKYRHPEDVFGEMSASIPELRGLSYENISRFGVRIAGEKRAHKLPYIYSDVQPSHGGAQ